MALKSSNQLLCRARILTCWAVLACAPYSVARDFPFFQMRFGFQKKPTGQQELTLVRVNIVTKFKGEKDTVEINGKLLTDYSPTIIQSFSSTGIVLDEKGNVMTLLGLRWLDLHDSKPSIEISRSGQKYKAKLVGVDQRNGVAVVRFAGGKLEKTPTCDDCEVRDGTTVMAPVSSEASRLRRAQIVSVAAEPTAPDLENWVMTLDKPFPDIWQPVLTSDHRVLGFIASQDPLGMRNIVYPISYLLDSARQIIKKNGDVFAGWLGLYVDSMPARKSGVYVQRVELDSPAQRAGFSPGDILLQYNGQALENSGQFVELVEGSQIGSKASIDILRKGNPMTVRASIEARKAQKSNVRLSFNLPGAFNFPLAGMVPDSPMRNQRLLIGVETDLLDRPIGGVKNGVLVKNVQKDSPAEKAGVLVNDIITSIDGYSIVDAPSFAQFLQTHNWGKEVMLRVSRKEKEVAIPVQLAN